MKQPPPWLHTLFRRFGAWFMRVVMPHWQLLLLFLFLSPIGVGIYLFSRTKEVADETSEVVQGQKAQLQEQKAVLQQQLAQEIGKRQEAEQKATIAEAHAEKAEKQAIVHEQRADSLLHPSANETSNNYRTATPERLTRFLTTYVPKIYLTGPRDTIR